MSLLSRGRGIEHEYIVNTDPPLSLQENTARRLLIARAIESLGEAGFLCPHVTWAVQYEEGNFEYEHSLHQLWPLETEPPSIATNGMRIYDDALHLEISTPVLSNPEEALAYVKASECLAFLASREVGAATGQDVYAYTSNISLYESDNSRTDGSGCVECGGLHDNHWRYDAVACGTHGNTTLSRHAFNALKRKEAQRALIPYLVTRAIVTGSGGYVPFVLDEKGRKLTKFNPLGNAEACGSTLVGDDISFVISPRSHFVNSIDSVDTTVKRGLFNLRDEPHADRDRYWRFHDINWEGIRCDLQIYVRDVLHAFVLAAFEKGYLQDAPSLHDPLGDIKSISMDAEMDWKVALSEGRRVDAVRDILIGYYLKRIEIMLDREQAPTEDWTAFSVLSRLLGLVAERDLSRLVYCLDWVTKLFLVEACDSQTEGLTACNQFSLLDPSVLEYLGEERVPNGDSLFQPGEAISRLIEWVPGMTIDTFRNTVQRALREPPTSTRETRRMQLIAEGRGTNMKASWEVVVKEDGTELWLPEPLR